MFACRIADKYRLQIITVHYKCNITYQQLTVNINWHIKVNY
jgi:hypothetical protein